MMMSFADCVVHVFIVELKSIEEMDLNFHFELAWGWKEEFLFPLSRDILFSKWRFVFSFIENWIFVFFFKRWFLRFWGALVTSVYLFFYLIYSDVTNYKFHISCLTHSNDIWGKRTKNVFFLFRDYKNNF